MPISKFKATCLAVLERVRKTGKPIQITRFGVPVAEVVPPSPPERDTDWLGSSRNASSAASGGSMSASGSLEGDIIGPAGDSSAWDALGA